jgi:hypothetical protein
MASVKKASERGVSTVIGEALLIVVATAAMSLLAYAVISGAAKSTRDVELTVRLVNADLVNDPFDNLVVALFNVGGDELGIPTGPDREFRVIGSYIGEDSWENTVPWDSWVFSDYIGGFGFGENVVGYLRHDDAAMHIGTKIRITVTDIYADKIIFREQVEIEDILLYL